MVFSQPLTAAELSLNQSIPAPETANKKNTRIGPPIRRYSGYFHFYRYASGCCKFKRAANAPATRRQFHSSVSSPAPSYRAL